MKRTSILSSAALALAATPLLREADPAQAAAAPAQGLPHMPAAVRNALAGQNREAAPAAAVPAAPLQTREDAAAAGAGDSGAAAAPAAAMPTAVQSATGTVVEGAEGGLTVNVALELRGMAERLGVARVAEQALVAPNATADTVRAVILSAVAGAQRQAAEGPSARIIVDERETFRGRAIDGLLLRARPNLERGMEAGQLAAAREFRGMSFERLAEETLRLIGGSVRGQTRAQLIRSALATTDFTQLLTGGLGRSLQAAYESVPVIYDQFCQRKTITDFRIQTAIGISGFGEMRVVPEGGEAKRKAMNEYPEQYRLAKMEEILSITFEALVNDDLGAFQGTSDRLALMARTSERRAVYQLFNGNGPTMADGLTLFHANHRNLITASPGAPNVARLGAVRQSLRRQTDAPQGTAASTDATSLNLGLQFVLSPTTHETTLDQLFAGVATGLQGDGAAIARTDLLLGNLKSVIPIVDPMLDDYSTANWFGLPAKEFGAIHYGYLEGEDGLVVEELPPGYVSGVEVKARLAFVAAAADWRGPVMHTG